MNEYKIGMSITWQTGRIEIKSLILFWIFVIVKMLQILTSAPLRHFYSMYRLILIAWFCKVAETYWQYISHKYHILFCVYVCFICFYLQPHIYINIYHYKSESMFYVKHLYTYYHRKYLASNFILERVLTSAENINVTNTKGWEISVKMTSETLTIITVQSVESSSQCIFIASNFIFTTVHDSFL